MQETIFKSSKNKDNSSFFNMRFKENEKYCQLHGYLHLNYMYVVMISIMKILVKQIIMKAYRNFPGKVPFSFQK